MTRLPVVLVLLASLTSRWMTFANGTLMLAASTNQAGPGPGDNVVVVSKSGPYVVTLAFEGGEAVTLKLERNGSFTHVGRTPVGLQPRAVALAHKGDLAIIANSIAGELRVFSVVEDAQLREINRVHSGGSDPFDVAVADDRLFIVANRGALGNGNDDNVTLFEVDRAGNMNPLGTWDPTGGPRDPHVVAVGRRGVVAVANQSSQDLDVFHLRRGASSQNNED